MRRAFDSVAVAIVRRRLLITGILLLITAASVVGYIDPDLPTRWLAQTKPAVQRATSVRSERTELPDVDPVDLVSSDSILVVQGDDFFTPRAARALRAVVSDLEQLDYVNDILWMDRVPILNIFGLPEPLFPPAHASEQRFAAARKSALQHPLVAGQLLSADGHTLIMLVRFNWSYVRSDEDCADRLRDVAAAAARRAGANDLEFQVTGRVPMFLAVRRSHDENHLKYQIIGYGMIALMAIILFRGLTAVVVVALAPALGVFWTLGFIRFFDFQQNPFNDVVLPVLLSLVGLTDGVHLMVQIRRLRSEGWSGREAAEIGIREVGLACALTSLTTAIGFGSLSLAHHEVVKEFGWCCVLGVILTFIAVVTVIPLACSTWLGRTVHVGHGKGWIDRHLSRISILITWVMRHTRKLSLASLLVTAALALVALQLEPDERNWSSLPDRSEPARAMQQMDEALGGLEQAEVRVTWSRTQPLDGARLLEVLREVNTVLEAEPLLAHPLSLYNLIEALPGEGALADRYSLVELLPPPLKRAFFQPEVAYAVVRFRVRNLGISRYAEVFTRVTQRLQEIERQQDGFRLSLQGSAVWRWENLYQIVLDLVRSLGSALVIIFLTLAVAYRSLRLGLISIVPNLFPLAVTASYLYISGQSLELVSVCAFTVCLGIAVDDTIHFITRYQEESERIADRNQAISEAFIGVGTALIMTTVILVAGFATVLWSDSRDHRIFASMGALTISAALFGDLVFLPALLARFDRRRGLAQEASSPFPASVPAGPVSSPGRPPVDRA